jgi:hypothetical protein
MRRVLILIASPFVVAFAAAAGAIVAAGAAAKLMHSSYSEAGND